MSWYLVSGHFVSLVPTVNLSLSNYQLSNYQLTRALRLLARAVCERLRSCWGGPAHVGALLKRPQFQRDLKLSDQINDAALSVMFNIAEGFLRRRDKETLQFLRYAFASNGELKSGYYAAAGRNYLPAEETAQ